MNYNDG
jgi:hypothetical protein